jgi:Flp pilus assembly pilin Flp
MHMINTINEKLLELVNRIRDERGQTSSEYVAVTAVAVAIALGVIYVTLEASLSSAVEAIGSQITDFVNNGPPVPEE